MFAAFIVCASVTALSAVVSLGFSLAAAMNETGNARTIAFYGCARSVALVVASAVPFFTGSTEWLEAVAWIMILVQAGDAIIGATIDDRMKTFGPAGMSLANLLALLWLIQSVQ